MTALRADVLRAAAFGGEPGRHPLPPAEDDESRWRRAVALGGQGRYANAAAELAVLVVPTTAPWLRSLAWSTRASHLRQVGGHVLARRLDGAALAVAARVEGGAGATARCDALVGLAADALGSGRIALARRLLVRAAEQLGSAEDRCTVRWCWVSAETALCADDTDAARAHAAAARVLADTGSSVRHQVKSLLVEAAAKGSTKEAEQAWAAAVEHGLLALRWAATMLLLALQGNPVGGQIGRENTVSHDLLARRGGVLFDAQGLSNPENLSSLVAQTGRATSTSAHPIGVKVGRGPSDK